MNSTYSISVFFVLFSIHVSVAQGGLLINASTYVVCSGTPTIVVDNGNFSNSGTFTAASSTLKMTGTALTSITGASTTSFNKLEISKTVKNLQLLKGISVGSEIKFTSGNIDLSNQIATLTGTAPTLTNENENSRFVAATTGTVTHTRVLSAPASLNVAKIGAQITSAANLGSTKIERGHKSYTVAPGIISINRFYRITPTYNTGLNATLRLYYFDAELNNSNEGTLEMMYSSNGVNWSKVMTGTIMRSSTENWVERTGFSSLSGYYTLANPTALATAANQSWVDTGDDATNGVSAGLKMDFSPNPTTGQMDVQIQSDKACTSNLSLYSIEGKLLKSEKIWVFIGVNHYSYDLSQMPSGIYFLKCEDLDVSARKVIKL